MTKINNLKRQGYKSRSSLKRKLENAAKADKKKIRLENEGEEHFLNCLLQETMFANIRKCVKCMSNIILATEIDQDHEMFANGSIQIENLQVHRRSGKLWLCKFCSEKDKSVSKEKSNIFVMKATEAGGNILYIPKLIGALGIEENDDVDQEQNPGIIDPSSKVSFPVGTESLSSYPSSVQLKSLSGFQIQQLLHQSRPITSDNLSLLYEHQLHKYKKSKASQDLYVGKIKDTASRTLTNAKPCSNARRISGSALWKSKQDLDVHSRMSQLGPHALFIEIDLPLKSSVMASVLSQENKVVSVEMVGGMTHELERVYKVHRSHNSDTDCRPDCQAVGLEDYMTEKNIALNLTNRNLSTHVLASDFFTNSFVSNILKSPSSLLYSEDYQLQTVFKEDGSLKVLGVIWPEKMKKMNLLNIDRSLSEENKELIQNDHLKFVGNTITTSSDAAVLKENFHLSDLESQALVRLVEKNQIHFCHSRPRCPRCENPELPSLELTNTITPENHQNLVTCTRLRHLFTEKLKNLSFDDLRSLEIMEWIEELSEFIEGNEINEVNIWSIQIEDETFKLFLDDILTGLILRFGTCPLAAAYQYSVMCVTFGGQVILKQRKLIESFTKPYNPFYLKAAEAQVSIKPVHGLNEWKNCKYSDQFQNTSNEPELFDHSDISFTEVLSLSDTNIKNVKASSKVEFLYTGPECKNLFKKVEKRTDKSYSVDGENFFLELQESAISKYFKRLNGIDLLLCEFAVWFDFLGQEKSESLFEVYKEKLGKIEDSSDASIMRKEALPELLLVENGNVFQKRKKPKILQHVDFDVDSYEYRYSQVILFGNNLNFPDLTKEFVENKYVETDEEGNSIVRRNRRLFLLKMRGK